MLKTDTFNALNDRTVPDEAKVRWLNGATRDFDKTRNILYSFYDENTVVKVCIRAKKTGQKDSRTMLLFYSCISCNSNRIFLDFQMKYNESTIEMF